MQKELLNNVIQDVQAELVRFQDKMVAYVTRAADDPEIQRGSRESAALRRGALDLKNELTRITQSIGS